MDRKPIAYLSQNKLEYFDLSGTPNVELEANVSLLFSDIDKLLTNHKAYSCLISWENKVHLSADKSLQEIFNIKENWSDNATYLIEKLGESYAGTNTYKKQTPEIKIKNSFHAFNNVFYDTLEYSINNSDFSVASALHYDQSLANTNNIFTINRKLLISHENGVLDYSGCVIENVNEEEDSIFKELLNNSLNRSKIEFEVRSNPQNSGKDATAINKLIVEECSRKRQSIRDTWKKIYFVVTPLCDFVQSKAYNVRVVKGMLIKADHLNYIDGRSEAIFISPKFRHNDDNFLICTSF
jgi:hypothetical protein